MLPIRDENPHFLTPYVTYGLVAINVVAWLVLQGAGAPLPLAKSLCTLGLLPAELLGQVRSGMRIDLGSGLACVLEARGHWSTLITHMFLHGGWMHLLGNMWFLWIFGNNVEDAMGHRRFILFYLLCGLAAAAAQMLSNPASPMPMVGASGAIGGVMGAYVMLYPRVNVHMLVWFGFYVTTIAIPAFWMLGYWFAVQVVGGLGSVGAAGGGVAFWAHIGGFVAGAVLIFLFRDQRLLDLHPHHGWHDRSSRSYRRLR